MTALSGEPGDPLAPVSSEPRWLRRYTLWVLGLVILFFIGRWAVHQLASFLIGLLCAFFLAFALEPGVNWLAARGWRRGFATLFIYLIAGLILGGIAVLIGGVLVNEVSAIASSLPDAIDSLQNWLKTTFNFDLTVSQDQLSQIGSFVIGGGALGIATSLVTFVFQLFTIALIAYYLAAEGPQFRRTVCRALPPARQVEVLQVWEIAIQKTAGFLYSRVLLAMVSAIAHGLFLWAIGVPYALALGIFVGLVSQFIPTIGTYIAGALPVLVAINESWEQALAVLAFVIIYQQIENYLLAPPLSARTMQLHPAVAFAAVIVGATLIGPAGAFLALPIVATVQAFASTYIREHELIRSEMLETHGDTGPAEDQDEDPDLPG